MKKARLLLGILSFLVILFSPGCKDLDNFDDQQMHRHDDQLGHLVIKLTDAPFPFDTIEYAKVFISKVEIRKACDCGEEGNPFTVLTPPDYYEEFDLLKLRNGITANLVEMEIDPGDYDLIRLYVDVAELKIKQGDIYTVKVPSGPQTGIKVFMNPDLKVVSSLTTDVVLDFNLEKSFVLKGNMNTPAGIKGFNFKPVIKAVNNTTAGTLAGTVKDAEYCSENSGFLPGAAVLIKQGEIKIDSVFTNEDGYYSIDSIPAGSYDIIASLSGFYDNMESVDIVEGNLTEQDFCLTAITGSLQGVVTDSITEAPLEGAAVSIEQDEVVIASVETGQDGSYSIDDIRIGLYNVIGTLEGYRDTIIANVEIFEGPPPTELDFVLTPMEEATTTTEN